MFANFQLQQYIQADKPVDLLGISWLLLPKRTASMTPIMDARSHQEMKKTDLDLLGYHS